MMTFSKIGSASGAASYYSHEDNYYVSGSLESKWMGKGAEKLGLTGPVENEKLTAVLQGKLPDGSNLSYMKDGKETHRPGYDLTFSAPKSVSVLALVGGDKRMIEAHNRAVAVAASQIETLTSTRVMENGKSEIVLTENMIAALFNHDTSRDLDPLVHTHLLVANVTENEGQWRSLSSDTANKNGFSETILANQVALGQIYRHVLKQDIEAMGHETHITGKNGLWEIVGVPVEPFSKRSQAINDAAGEGASLKSRDIATLDTRKAKVALDPALLLADWQRQLKETGFDIQAFQQAAQARAMSEPLPPELSVNADMQVNKAVQNAISLLSDNKVQFTYSEMLAKTVGQLPAEAGVFDLARKGIEAAIETQRLIPLDKEKGLFTSDIHLLDELSIHALSKEVMQDNRVLQFSDKNVYPSIQSSAVYQLTTNASPVAVLSGIGGASVQRDRVVEVVSITQQQGRQTFVLSPDKRSQEYLGKDERLQDGVEFLFRQDLNTQFTLPVNSTLVIDQAEKLTLKETLSVLEQGRNQNAQIIFMDTEQRKGTGNALSILQDADVPRYQFSGRERVDVAVISQPDKRERYQQLANDYVHHQQQGTVVTAQVAGNREQAVLTNVIREALKETGQIDRQEVNVAVLTPVFLDSKTRRQRDSYKSGQIMEYWDKEAKERTRYTIDRVTPQTNTLTLINTHGESLVEKIGQLDNRWSLYQPGQLAVAEGDTLKALGRELNGDIKARDMLTVTAVTEEKITLLVNGKARELSTQGGIKLTHGYVEGLGSSVSDKAVVLAAVSAKDMSATALNQLSRSGQHVGLYTATAQDKAEQKLALSPHYHVVSTQVKTLAGKDSISDAVTHLRDQLNTPVQQSVHLGLQHTQANGVVFSRTNLLSASLGRTDGVSLQDIDKEISRQVKDGDLIALPVVKGQGNDLLVARASYDTERSIIRSVAEGKDQVTPLMATVPEDTLQGLTEGQQSSTRLILQTTDRFVAIQGYAGVGKTTQFKAVLAALGTLPDGERPTVIGLAPTHRAVHEMQEIGVKAQTLASFLSEESQRQQSGGRADYSQTVFLIDESSMIANRDMANVYQLIEKTGGRAVSSGDVAQLQPIDPGQPFKLQQQRSAIDVAVMKDIVRQSPELKPAIYSMIDGNQREALNIINTVGPESIPRREGAWVPPESVLEIRSDNAGTPTPPTVLAGNDVTFVTPRQPTDIITAISQDYSGRSDEARKNTLIIVHVNNDRHRINQQIHADLRDAGLVGEKEVSIPVLQPVAVRSSSLRSASGFEVHQGRLALLDNQYYTIIGVDKEKGIVSLKDADNNPRLLSSFEASKEEISLYEPTTMYISEGDKIRFSRTDNDRGYVANSVWEVKSLGDDKITLTNGLQDKVVEPAKMMADQHIDLAYAITAHGAQGASSQFVIALEGTDGGRKSMVSAEGAYVALSRTKEHVQVYTDNKEGWLNALSRHSERPSAHDILHQADDHSAAIAARLLETAKPLQDTSLGRALLKTSELSGQSMAYFISANKKYPQPHIALPVYDSNGKKTGVYLDELRHLESGRSAWLSQESRIIGGDDARFAGLQVSKNGDVHIASDMTKAMEVAMNNPEAGVLIRLHGEGEPHNISRITGERIVPDNAVLEAATAQDKADTSAYPFISTEQEKLAKEQAEAALHATELTDKELKNEHNKEETTLKSAAEQLTGEDKGLDDKSLTNVANTLDSRDTDKALNDVVMDLQKERMSQMEREIVKEKEIGE